MSEEKTQWTIVVTARVNNFSHGQKRHVEWVGIELEEISLAEFRAQLEEVEGVSESGKKDWREVLASGAVSVSLDGMEGLMRLCGDNESLRVEMEAMLVKTWYMGRAYERKESKLKRSETP